MEVVAPRRRGPSPVVRRSLDVLGGALFATGAVGIVTPGLPTTVFWIGAVMCFLKSRPGAVRPILRTPLIGRIIIAYLRWRPFGGGRKRHKKPA